jgi:glutaminyl-tRNA synthetase
VQGTIIEITKQDGTVERKQIPPAVRGWDDPRLLTLVAIRRRGVPAQAILNFVSELGVTDANTNIQVFRFDAVIRKYLERTVPRLMLVLDPIPVTIEDLPDGYVEELIVPYDPKNPEGDKRPVPVTKTVYIERSDFREEDSSDFFRLAPGKPVGLLNVPFAITATTFVKGSDGAVVEIKAVKVEGVKPKAYIHWVASTGIKVVARQYNALFKSEEPNALDWKTGGFADDLNPESEINWPNAIIEPAFDVLRKDHAEKPSASSDDLVRFQAIRTGYFCIDPDEENGKVVLNQIVTLKEDAGKGK